ncbi:PDR/VanB family oxidoreductase [Pseudoduganella umbonata]|uniref:Oxidoreductase n=1 Tax=Pseudoduganella umbonata TaxID=864828 RepID=A0A4P8HMK3_9BURK|nr:PDR/VanB family oxidoreductase [Pseudoduganella umbonata]MBB3219587.1 vanillate O-demethylase ferredoxin subunit [Pseudoduganella umbonata]QCP09654.1 oxidoreductase [Pseudoduganella umbonata]
MSNSQQIAVRVQAMRYEAAGIVSVELVPPQGGELPAFEAGAHIDLHLPNGVVRSYSLWNPPQERHRYVIGVLHDRNSRGGSRYVHEQLRVGAAITIGAPRNNFPLDVAAAHTVLVAGGIGITPILGMLRELQRLGKSVELLYCARSRSEAAFADALAAEEGVRVHFDGEAGGPPDLRGFLAAKSPADHFYCCGPTPMLNAFESTCAELGLPNVHIERFAPAEPAVATQGSAYECQLARSQKLILVPPGKSLLDALLEAGADVDHSCREGVCGSCETAVLDGMPEHRDGVLTKAERESGKTMMVCVSGCKGRRLVLDL